MIGRSCAVRRGRGGEALEQGVLGLRVERGGRLVEHQQQRILAHEAAGQGELLPLTEGHLDAVVPGRPELGVEPGGQPRRRRPPRRPGDGRVHRGLVVERGGGRRRPTVCRAWNSKRKKSWNAPDSRARHSSARMRARSTPSTLIARGRLVQPGEQLDQGRLARAVLTDDGHDRARRQVEADVLEHQAARCRDR